MTCKKCQSFDTGRVELPVLPGEMKIEHYVGMLLGFAQHGGTCLDPNGKCTNAASKWSGVVCGPQGTCDKFAARAA